jgi:hypothetical protein
VGGKGAAMRRGSGSGGGNPMRVATRLHLSLQIYPSHSLVGSIWFCEKKSGINSMPSPAVFRKRVLVRFLVPDVLGLAWYQQISTVII